MKSKVYLVLGLISFLMISSFFSFSQSNQFQILVKDKVNGELFGLNELLAMGIPETNDNVACKSTWRVFYFRINYKGKVDNFFVDKENDLDSIIINKIKENIFKTEGHWQISKIVKKGEFCSFIYPYFRYSLNHRGCTETEIEIKKQLSRLSYVFHKCHTNSGAIANGTFMIIPEQGGFEKE